MISPIPGIRMRIRATDAYCDRLGAIIGSAIAAHHETVSEAVTLERCAKAERILAHTRMLDLSSGHSVSRLKRLITALHSRLNRDYDALVYMWYGPYPSLERIRVDPRSDLIGLRVRLSALQRARIEDLDQSADLMSGLCDSIASML